MGSSSLNLSIDKITYVPFFPRISLAASSIDMDSVTFPSIFINTSPASIPARLAGEFSVGAITMIKLSLFPI